MIGYDLLFDGAVLIAVGFGIVRGIKRIQHFIASIPFLRDHSWSFNPGGDPYSSLTRFSWLAGAWLFIAVGIWSMLWFILINLHLVHWPKY